ncbi:MAG: hypothetical protein QXE92_00315 [Thermofilaceae archaeon]
MDEVPAVTDVTVYAAPPLIKELEKRLPFFVEMNKVVGFEGEWIQTEHKAFFEVRSEKKLRSSPSYCYVVGRYAFIDESAEAFHLLQMFREKGLIPLFHWQPRDHIDVGRRITHRDLPDGYLLDNRTWTRYAPNVIPKCVPSLQDIKQDPEKWKNNAYSKFFV